MYSDRSVSRVAPLVLRPEQRARLRSIGRTSGPATIDCGSEHHRLSTQDGWLHTHDHDATGELALHALGGGLPECLVYLLVWRQSFADGFLPFWAEHEKLDRLQRAHLRREWVDNYWEGWPPEPPAGAVLFEQRWQNALGAAVARETAGGKETDRMGAIHRAVQVRVRSAFVKSLGGVSAHTRPDALVPLRVVVGAGPASVTGRLARTESSVEIHVTADWLWEVWATGYCLVDGKLVIGRDKTNVQTVEWHPTGGAHREHTPAVSPWRRLNLRQ